MTDDTMPEIPGWTEPGGDLVAAILGRLMAEPDAATRLRACRALDGTTSGLSGRIGWVRKVSVAQLVAQGHSYSQIGATMEVTKMRVGQIHNDRAVEDPFYLWGRMLSTLGALAVDQKQADEADRLVTTGLASTAIRARLMEAAGRFARRSRRAGGDGGLLARMDELNEATAGLPVGPMTIDQRAQVVLGLHHETSERLASTS